LQGAAFCIDNTFVFQERMLVHLYPKFKIGYRYSLLFFSGCLYSFGLLPGMGGINQTRDRDLKDKIVSI